jgi:4-amino-4-deoxy-L-arabinose transferase-like glycosyltransferase
VILLALVVRTAVVIADTGYVPAHDAYDYDRHARSIAAGEGYPESAWVRDGGPSAYRPPVYPYFLGAVYAVSGDSQTAGRVANIALGGVMVLLLYLIANRIWGRRVALVAAGMAAVFPPLVLISRDLLSEPLFLVIELGAVLCVLAFRRSGALRWAAAAGVLCGVAALTRNPAPALLVPIALGVWILRPRLRARALAAPALLLLCAALTAAPWTVRNLVEFGGFVPVSNSTGFALSGTYNETSLRDDVHPAGWRPPRVSPEYEALFRTPGIDEGTLDDTLRRESVRFAWEHPGYVAKAMGQNLLRLFEVADGSFVGARIVDEQLVATPRRVVDDRGIGSATPISERVAIAIAAALALMGLVAILGSRRAAGKGDAGKMRFPPGPWFLWLVPVALLIAAAPVNGAPRYRLPADPILLILAAIGLVWALDRVYAAWKRRAGRHVVSTALVAGFAVIALAGCGDDGNETPAATTTSTTAANDGSTEQRYVNQANAICRHTVRKVRGLGRRFGRSDTTDSLARTTDELVRPGLAILESQARQMRAIEPAPEDQDLQRYVELFDPILALGRERFRAGRAGELDEARRLEMLGRELGEEQLAAARRAGLRDCEVDVEDELFAAAAGRR